MGRDGIRRRSAAARDGLQLAWTCARRGGSFSAGAHHPRRDRASAAPLGLSSGALGAGNAFSGGAVGSGSGLGVSMISAAAAPSARPHPPSVAAISGQHPCYAMLGRTLLGQAPTRAQSELEAAGWKYSWLNEWTTPPDPGPCGGGSRAPRSLARPNILPPVRAPAFAAAIRT